MVRYYFADDPLRLVYSDPACEELWGIPLARLRRETELWFRGIHARDRPHIEALYSGPPRRWEVGYQVVRADGQTLHVVDHGAVLEAPRRGRHVTGRVVDVTKERRLEDQLHLQGQLLEAVGQAVVAVDSQGRVASWNPAAEALYGWPAGEALGRQAAQLSPTLARWHEQLQRRDPWSGQLVAEHRSGRQFVSFVTIASLRGEEDEPAGWVGVASDVGERREAEAALHESEERYRKLVQQSGEGILVAHAGEVLYANEAAARLFGLASASEADGRALAELVHPRDAAGMRRLGRQLEQANGARHTLVDELRRADGAALWIELSSVPVSYRGLDAQQVFVRDVGERMRVDAELRASREELRRLHARVQIVREQEQTRIGRDIHDELGQMLTGIKLDIAWLQRRATEGQAELPRERLRERLDRLAQLVDESLDGARRIALQLRPSVLDDLGLEAAVDWLVKEFAARSGIPCDLTCELSGLLPASLRDTAVFRILQEALTNVARHAGASRCAVSVRVRGDGMRLAVTDDGRGVERGAQRAAGALGIVGMRERARACGGELVVRKRAGGGTRVAARLPLVPPVETPREAAPAAQPPAGRMATS
ncbi:MAG TPA: PAS domain S-box protein [Thermoanaerobaculia bacterium]|nr:PAS domain S-box protein [Thermoanaerobaculia bacterium]